METLDLESVESILLESNLFKVMPFPLTIIDGQKYLLLHLIYANAIDGCVEVKTQISEKKRIRKLKEIKDLMSKIQKIGKDIDTEFHILSLEKKRIELILDKAIQKKGKKRVSATFALSVIAAFEIQKSRGFDRYFLEEFLKSDGLLDRLLNKDFSKEIINRAICFSNVNSLSEKRWDHTYIESLERSAYAIGLDKVEKRKSERFQRMQKAFMDKMPKSMNEQLDLFIKNFDEDKLLFYSYFVI